MRTSAALKLKNPCEKYTNASRPRLRLISDEYVRTTPLSHSQRHVWPGADECELFGRGLPTAVQVWQAEAPVSVWRVAVPIGHVAQSETEVSWDTEPNVPVGQFLHFVGSPP